jgi:uncharacterized protein (DUF1810 family)
MGPLAHLRGRMPNPYNLQRFLDAQAPVYARVLAELGAGRKQSHWMWFVFPQLTGLGHSPIAQTFGISSLEEAKAYLAHEVLGPRLAECTRLVLAAGEQPIGEILGYPDDLKFRSCMTLFARAAGEAESVFTEALARFFAGEPDSRTLELLK